MQRASKIFVLEEAVLRSPFVEKIWRTRSAPAQSFISVAASHSQIVITKVEGRTSVTFRGPETKATTLPIPQDAEFFGIQLQLGAFMPSLPVQRLVDSAVTLPAASCKAFWLNSSALEIPNYNNAEAFVDSLVREGLLIRDPLIESPLKGHLKDVSQRSVQRRFRRGTGLTQATFRQIERADSAVDLLEGGASLFETVQRAGYADQAHLTRSLKRFVGQTPTQIVRERTSR